MAETRVFGLVTAAVATFLAHAAQAEPYKPPPKRISPFAAYAATQVSDKPAPRTAWGVVDLSGMWTNIPSPAGPGGVRKAGTFEPDQAVLQRASGWEKPIYKPEFWEKVRSLDFSKVNVDPFYNCGPAGIPRSNIPSKIVQTPSEIILFHGPRARIVPVDGRPRSPDDLEVESFDGVPLGRWEGDVLVIESVGFNDVSWLQWQGYFHSNMMKVTERIWRKGDLLYYQFTVDDPDVLMEPWTQGTMVRRLNPDRTARIEEQGMCTVFEPEGDLYLRG